MTWPKIVLRPSHKTLLHWQARVSILGNWELGKSFSLFYQQQRLSCGCDKQAFVYCEEKPTFWALIICLMPTYWEMSFFIRSRDSTDSCGCDKHDASSVPHWPCSHHLLFILSNISTLLLWKIFHHVKSENSRSPPARLISWEWRHGVERGGCP